MALNFVSKLSVSTIRIQSFTDQKTWYEVDPAGVTCTCGSFHKNDKCKHLEHLGLWKKNPFKPRIDPTFSQALCALVKGIRVRNLPEVVYWMVYMDSYKFKDDPSNRFRVARRLLIGAAEDGMSVSVMEKTAANFANLAKNSTELFLLVAEAARICAVPNWWHPATNGPLYIYESMIGQRQWLYEKWDHKVESLKNMIRMAMNDKNAPRAIGGLMQARHLKEPFGSTAQAEFLREYAKDKNHELAIRLLDVHLYCKSALSNDNNFLAQAVWVMSGGFSPAADKIQPVTKGDCMQLIADAKESWKTPHPVPTWACDGVHCAGNDTRFMGMLPEMNAVCNAYKHYQKIDPNDEWLPSFMSYDGLKVELPLFEGKT